MDVESEGYDMRDFDKLTALQSSLTGVPDAALYKAVLISSLSILQGLKLIVSSVKLPLSTVRYRNSFARAWQHVSHRGRLSASGRAAGYTLRPGGT